MAPKAEVGQIREVVQEPLSAYRIKPDQIDILAIIQEAQQADGAINFRLKSDVATSLRLPALGLRVMKDQEFIGCLTW
jgi:hypothetical protein